jgi:tetratricopeptide (TPR) repeat protein
VIHANRSKLNGMPNSAVILLSFVFAAPILMLQACTSQTTKEERVVLATEHIENPIRTLEARAELETLGAMTRASDALLSSIVPDALDEIVAGTPEYQRAMMERDQIRTIHSIESDAPASTQEEIDPDRRSSAIKLYTQARAIRQAGQSTDAIELLKQASRLDPGSASIQRELGDALIISNDQVGALRAFERAIELGDRSPRALIHLATDASSKSDHDRTIWLTSQALESRSINNHPLARSIAGVLLGTSEIHSGFLKDGAQTLGESLQTFDTGARDLRWRREIIQIMSQRGELWILTGDAWASIGAHQRAQDAYANAGLGVEHSPLSLVARQIASSLRQGHPANASLILLDHLQNSASDLGQEEHAWSRSLSSIDGIGDVLGAAIGELSKRPGLTPSIRQSLLSIELVALDSEDRITRLANAGQDANDPLVSLETLIEIEDESDRYRAATTIIESNPNIARAIATSLSRTLINPVKFMQERSRTQSATDELLMASVGVGLGRADLIEHLGSFSIKEIGDRTDAWVGVHAQALALTGQWDRLESMIPELQRRTELGNTEATRQLASTLLIAQQPSAAMEVISLQADDANAGIQDLMLGAQIAQVVGEYDSAAAFLERASELDPYHEEIYEQLFLMRSSSSPIGDEEELRFVVRQLGTTRSRSSLFGLIRANELARNGFVQEAESLLIELNTNYPYREIGFDLLLSIWKTHQEQENSTALDDGIAWLESRFESDHNSIQTLMVIAQGLFELDAHDRAQELLQSGYARTGSFELARAIEQILAASDEQPLSPDQHLKNRLVGLRGIDPTIELAMSLAREAQSDQTTRMLELLNSNLPAEIELLPTQRAQLTQIVFTLTESLENTNNESDILDLISIIEQRIPKLGFPLARVKLILLAQQPKLDLDQTIETTLALADQAEDNDQRNTLLALPIQSLLGEDRSHEAIAFIARLATHSGTLDVDLTIETYRLLAAVGTNADMIGVLDLLEERGLMDETITLTTAELGTPNRDKPAITPDQMRADLAYTAAAVTTAFERDEQAQSFYELSLSFDPDHAWSNNDFGYMLAENGEQMDYAVELLERAARALPNEASVIDSLAWVRYKMGMFDDELDENGRPVTPGAISLLMRATNLDIRRENATIMLHLGDALWRGGYKDRAKDAWLTAEDILRSRIRLMNSQSPPNPRAIDAMSAELREIRYRLQDAESTGNPKIAPLANEPDPN